MEGGGTKARPVGRAPTFSGLLFWATFYLFRGWRCGLASVSSEFMTSTSALDRRPSSPSSSLPGPLETLQGRAEGQLYPQRLPNPTLLVCLWGS